MQFRIFAFVKNRNRTIKHQLIRIAVAVNNNKDNATLE